jgi:signal transduction histidine kinase
VLIRIGKIYSKTFYRTQILNLGAKFINLSQMLSGLLSMLPIGLIVFSKDLKKIDLSSQVALDIFNIDKNQGECNAKLFDCFQQYMGSLTNKYFKKDEKSYIVNTISTEENVIVSLTDITAINELDSLKSESNIKTNLMQTLRHEIRTPLNGIGCLVKSLKNSLKGKLNEESKQLISITLYSCNMISNLLNNFTVKFLAGLCAI